MRLVYKSKEEIVFIAALFSMEVDEIVDGRKSNAIPSVPDAAISVFCRF